MNFIKKCVKWYFKKAVQTYAWTPSGIVPFKQGMDA